jgi:arsenite methyltransferase
LWILLIDEYRRLLIEAGFTDVLVVDSDADLNAYAKVEGQSGCCSPTASSSKQPSVSSACCSSAKPSSVTLAVSASCCGSKPAANKETVHEGLAGLLDRYDVNEYAASVKVYALKPNT